MDYVTINRRWRNAARNAARNVHANVDTDHYPLIIDLQVRLKAREERNRVNRKKYMKCSEEQRETFYGRLGEMRGENGSYDSWPAACRQQRNV